MAASDEAANDCMIVDGKDESKEERPLTAPVPKPPSTPLPGHLLLLLAHIISLCESVSKCSQQFRRFVQQCEDWTNVNSFTQLRSCHRHCPVMIRDHLSNVVKLCKEGAFDLEQFNGFADVMENLFKGKYFLEAQEYKFIRSQFTFTYGLIKQARFEFSVLQRFNLLFLALMDMPHERKSEFWLHAVGFFPYVLELAQTQWKRLAPAIDVELDDGVYLPTLFISTSVQNLVNKFLTMIELEPKAFINGGEEDFSDASSLSCDSDGTFDYLREQRDHIIFDLKHALKIAVPLSDESASSDEDE